MTTNYVQLFFSDERVRDESIANPTKKFEIETYNMVMDRTLFELSERFKSTNIGPLRDNHYYQLEE